MRSQGLTTQTVQHDAHVVVDPGVGVGDHGGAAELPQHQEQAAGGQGGHQAGGSSCWQHIVYT